MSYHKKHLGQHFLHDPKLLQKVVNASPARSSDTVLEIGPGDGSLTRAILDSGCRVIAVEVDGDLLENLRIRFRNEIANGQMQLIHSDFLNTNIVEIVGGNNYHVIANIPYYITGAILRKLLTDECQPRSLTLIMQREVGERIVCRDGKQSLLSLSVSVYGVPSIAFRIARGAFVPAPDVDSVVLVVSDISRQNFQSLSGDTLLHERRIEALFFEIIHLGFAQKRKQLYKLISAVVTRTIFESWCDRQQLPYDVRAEDVPLLAWIDLVLCIA